MNRMLEARNSERKRVAFFSRVKIFNLFLLVKREQTNVWMEEKNEERTTSV